MERRAESGASRVLTVCAGRDGIRFWSCAPPAAPGACPGAAGSSALVCISGSGAGGRERPDFMRRSIEGRTEAWQALFFGGPTPFLCQALSRREQPGWTAARARNQGQHSCPVSSPRRREAGRREQAQRDGRRCQKKWGREKAFSKDAVLGLSLLFARAESTSPSGET